MDKGVLLVAVLFAASAWPSSVASQEVTGNARELLVFRESTHSRRIVVPAEDGQIAWSDIVCGIARAQQLDDEVLRPLLPSGRIHLDRKATRFQLRAVSLALPGVRMRVIHSDEAHSASALEIRIDEAAFEAARRNVTRFVRAGASRNGEFEQALAYGLHIEREGDEDDTHRPLVAVLHGLNSRPSHMSGVVEKVRERGLLCGTYGYPNDAPISEAARQLARALKLHADAFPQQRLILITHSMGGLIARAVIEDPLLDPGNVRQLVMIAPPTHGSELARVAHGLDVWEHLLSRDELEDISWCRASIIDGLAEANRDLRPGSPFLRELNARSRNPAVRYSILLGTDGPLSAERMNAIRAALNTASDRSRLIQLFHPLTDDFLADLDEVVQGKGDGVVALKRARLAGVDDIVVLNFKHSAAIGTAQSVDQRLLDELLARLPKATAP